MDYHLYVRNAPIHHSEKIVNRHATAQKRGVTMWLGVLYSKMTQVLTIVIYIRHVAAGVGEGLIIFLYLHHGEKNIDQNFKMWREINSLTSIIHY